MANRRKYVCFRKPKEASMPVQMRHVVYHPSNGIFLGVRDVGEHFDEKDVVWSRVTAGLTGKEMAPTFTDRTAVEEYLKAHGVSEGFPKDYSLREVHTKHEKYMADVETCANAGMPRWGNT